MPKYAKKAFGRKGYKRYKKFSKIKKLVTGEGPTLLEKIASGVGGVASVAKAVLPAIAAINTEAKYLDSSAGLSPTLAAPSIINVSLMAQGLTDVTRIGNSILAKNVQGKIRLVTFTRPATNPATQSVRLMLICDKLQGGTAPTITQIMSAVSSNLSLANKNYTDRFTVIMDKILDFQVDYNGTGDLYGVRTIKFFKNLNFHIRYLGTDATDASAGPNQLYLICWPNSNLAGNCSFTYYVRMNYTDN